MSSRKSICGPVVTLSIIRVLCVGLTLVLGRSRNLVVCLGIVLDVPRLLVIVDGRCPKSLSLKRLELTADRPCPENVVSRGKTVVRRGICVEGSRLTLRPKLSCEPIGRRLIRELPDVVILRWGTLRVKSCVIGLRRRITPCDPVPLSILLSIKGSCVAPSRRLSELDGCLSCGINLRLCCLLPPELKRLMGRL